MRTIPSSELIINDDGSIFHLHLKPGAACRHRHPRGGPGRVAMVASFSIRRSTAFPTANSITVTGTYKGKRMTVLSTGIGIGNIDISVTELDALANVDFATRQEKAQKRQLTLVRLGTSGAIQPTSKWGSSSSPHFGRLRRSVELLQGAQRGLRPGDREGFYETYGLERFASEALFHRCGSFAGRAFPRRNHRRHHHRRPRLLCAAGNAGCVSNRPTSI